MMAGLISNHAPPSLRIAVVQFAPKIGQIDLNIAKARELCAKIKPHSVDLVCLPEMIFSGYMFPDAQSIRPYLEHPHQGPTSLFCSGLALSLRCYVTAGYPERLSSDEVEGQVEDPINPAASLENASAAIEKVGANSAVLYGPDGKWVGGYRKTNLFRTDLTWATPGTGFTTFHLPAPLNTVTLAICNDLNVKSSTSHLPLPDPSTTPASQSCPSPSTPPWTLKDGPFELADYCVEHKTDLLVLLDAWLDSGESADDGDREAEETNYDWDNVNYWAARLRPLWAKEGMEGGFVEDGDLQETNKGEETVVVVCNRFGDENGERFAGTSSLLSLRRGSGRPRLLEAMGRREEGVRLWTVQ